ncbi:hypothetical protein N7456_003678 [Penicillium angulare]|uniref:Short-chain dehydrogenase/reductase SDR n=1 Tax=Penicillium angulare TaxID=116970 RepID=A0A9W9FV77_9EURO|nr:hypothetical protein N7456_003678 [Penicillium angulare]
MAGQLIWLVTGCTSGLGEALAQAILSKGDKVIATARGSKGVSGIERLSALEESGAAVLELDITASQEELNEKAKEAWDIYGRIDVLVNNAGSVKGGLVEEINEEIFLDVIRTNVSGPMNLTRALLPFMRARRSGTLLFTGSISHHLAITGSSCYIGSKGLLDAIIPTLALEVAPFDLRVCNLSFGFFRTELMSENNATHATAKQIPELAELHKVVEDSLEVGAVDWPGDPRKGCELVVEAVRGEGRCAGKELPLRLPIGSDAPSIIRNNCSERMKICDEWEGITTLTNRD